MFYQQRWIVVYLDIHMNNRPGSVLVELYCKEALSSVLNVLRHYVTRHVSNNTHYYYYYYYYYYYHLLI